MALFECYSPLKKREVLSEKNLQFERTPFDKWFMYIRNNNGPKRELWEPLPLTLPQNKCCSFKADSSFWQYRKFCRTFKWFPEVPLMFSLRINYSCHTL